MENQEQNNIQCSVCGSREHRHFITTHAMMHHPNEEVYHFNKCAQCRSVFLKNPVDEKELENYYTENYLPYRGAQAWGKFESFVEKNQDQLDGKRARFIGKLVQKNQSFSILDVGCGHPSFLNTVQQKMNASCTGVDFSDKGWRDDKYLLLDLIECPFEDFEPKKKFDIITLWHYLEHDYNLQETVKKLYTILKPGGKLVIEVPDYRSYTARKQKKYWQGWHSPRHLTLFSKKGFRLLFPKTKWKIKKHLRYGTLDTFTLWWLGKMEKKQVDWSASMEKEFWPLVFLKVISAPVFLFERFVPMGIQLLVIEKNSK